MQFKTAYTLQCLFFKQKYRIFKIAQDLQPYKISLNTRNSVYFSALHFWLMSHHLESSAGLSLLLIPLVRAGKWENFLFLCRLSFKMYVYGVITQ